MKWLIMRKGTSEVKTNNEERAETLLKQGYEIMSVIDLKMVSKCKEG